MNELELRLETLLGPVDSRLRASVLEEVARWAPRRELVPDRRIVLLGHRSAGKSALLPRIAELLQRPGIDLDAEIEGRTGSSTRALYLSDAAGFRRAERDAFGRLPRRAVVVAAGGGFLANHADLLIGSLPVLIPISFETYCQRLRADLTRPRLRPQGTLEEELESVFREREALHGQVEHWPLARLLAAALVPAPRRVVTLPPSIRGTEAALAFASRARTAGADLLELRTDLHRATDLDVRRLAAEVPLLASERGAPLPDDWLAHAWRIDRPLSPEPADTSLLSLHASDPLPPEEADETWAEANAPAGTWIKHVEPLGASDQADRLFETQRLLSARFGAGRVTVLATGPLALPWRCLLARANALDYCALDAAWAAAPGQRLLSDAVRASSRAMSRSRRGILGSHLAHSRSPRIHRQPFDRIDLPADSSLGLLLQSLRPHYAGFAVTSPFKKLAAAASHSRLPAVNTLVRRENGWEGFNTDVEGARAVLRRLGEGAVTVLGDGGAAAALRLAAADARRAIEVIVREHAARCVEGLAVWTWPDGVEPPAGLRFSAARVAVIAYGAPGARVANQIRQLGGTPVRLGAAWFIAQARVQRRLWGES